MKKIAANTMTSAATWCGHGDSNPNASLHENLNLACLPIPSCPHISAAGQPAAIFTLCFSRRGFRAGASRSSRFYKNRSLHVFTKEINKACQELKSLHQGDRNLNPARLPIPSCPHISAAAKASAVLLNADASYHKSSTAPECMSYFAPTIEPAGIFLKISLSISRLTLLSIL